MHETKPSLVSPTRPWPLCHKVCVWMGLLILVQIVAVVLQGAALIERHDDHDDPAPVPSPSPSSTWSSECTVEDLDDGACLTWDDIRNQPTYTQSPTP